MRNVLVAVALGVALLGLLRPTLELGLPLGANHNEGWNAHHARSVSDGGILYPPATDFVSNNYPPLSFLALGLAARAGLDPLVCGRVLALTCLLGVALLLGYCTRRITGSSRDGWLATFLVLATIPAYYRDYVAMNDPQFFGHALQFIGLALLLRDGELSRRRLWAVGVWLLLGGLVKHNLVAVPMGISAWIGLRHPRLRSSWTSVVATMLVLWFLIVGGGFGSTALAGVFGHARSLHAHTLALALSRWWLPLLPLIGGAAFAWWHRPRDSRVELFLWILISGAGAALIFSAGSGISYNVLFDVIFAATLLAIVATRECVAARWLFMLPPLLMAPRIAMETVEFARERPNLVRAARQDLAWVEARPGPLLCEDSALSYRLHRPFEVGFFNYGQKLATGRVLPERLLDKVRSLDYAVVQVDRRDARTALGEEFRQTLLRHYELARTSSVYGYFYLPRGEQGSAH